MKGLVRKNKIIVTEQYNFKMEKIKISILRKSEWNLKIK